MSPRHNAIWRAALSLAAMAVIGACNNEDPLAARQKEIARRGATVMPFDLEKTTHVFVPLEDGGIQRVVVDEVPEDEQLALVRSHLRKEAAAFTSGDFSDPAAIHGESMPGLQELTDGYRDIDVRYQQIPQGAKIRYKTDDPAMVSALARWFEAQLTDHGGHAEHES